MRLPHLIHRDPSWQIHGANAYHQCQCGARRTVRAYRTMISPVDRDWPPLIDSHGRPIADSGWQRPA